MMRDSVPKPSMITLAQKKSDPEVRRKGVLKKPAEIASGSEGRTARANIGEGSATATPVPPWHKKMKVSFATNEATASGNVASGEGPVVDDEPRIARRPSP